MADESDFPSEKKAEALTKLQEKTKEEPTNGGEEQLESPMVLTMQLSLLMDSEKVKRYDVDKLVLYILDRILAGSANLRPIAEKIKKEVSGQPRLLIPTHKIIH